MLKFDEPFSYKKKFDVSFESLNLVFKSKRFFNSFL